MWVTNISYTQAYIEVRVLDTNKLIINIKFMKKADEKRLLAAINGFNIKCLATPNSFGVISPVDTQAGQDFRQLLCRWLIDSGWQIDNEHMYYIRSLQPSMSILIPQASQRIFRYIDQPWWDQHYKHFNKNIIINYQNNKCYKLDVSKPGYIDFLFNMFELKEKELLIPEEVDYI
jgi:hypothetical protein